MPKTATVHAMDIACSNMRENRLMAGRRLSAGKGRQSADAGVRRSRVHAQPIEACCIGNSPDSLVSGTVGTPVVRTRSVQTLTRHVQSLAAPRTLFTSLELTPLYNIIRSSTQ